MKFNSFSILFLLVLGITVNSSAQRHNWCGTTHEDQVKMKEQMFQNRIDIPNVAETRGGTTYIRIQPHIIRTNEGTAGINESKVLESICIMNEFYNQIDIHFYLNDQGIKYINNTSAYNDPSPSHAFLRQRKDPSSLNIYFVGSIPSSGPGTTQAYYTFPPNDFVVCDNDFATFDNVLPHEIGHFFTLAHPFFGWESEPWDVDIHGSPVGPTSPGGVANEKVDGSNCLTAGDGICDTPPDYLFAFNDAQNGCTPWPEICMDPDSAVINPQEENLISYFEPCLNYVLTDGQKQEMLRDLASARRARLRSGAPAITEPVTEIPVSISPIADDVIDGYENVLITWNKVPNAERYMLEVDRSLFDFNSDFLVRVITEDTSAVVSLTRRREWAYRVKAYNNAFPCTEFNEEIEFRTGDNPVTSIQTIDELNDWTVMPNPIQSGRQLNLQISASESFDATIKIYNLVGQEVFVQQQEFSAGQTTTLINTKDLTQGMYIVQLDSQNGRATQKLIVSQ